MNQKEFIERMDDDQMVRLVTDYSMDYRGTGFNGTCGIAGKKNKHTHCFSPLAGNNCDCIVIPQLIKDVPAGVTDLFADYIKAISSFHPLVAKNFEAYPPFIGERELTARFSLNQFGEGNTGYVSYVAFVMWRHMFQNPKAVPMLVYLHQLGFTGADLFMLWIEFMPFWYRQIYGGMGLNPMSSAPKGHIHEYLTNLTKQPHNGNYGMGYKICPGGDVYVGKNHAFVETLEDITVENCKQVLDLY